MVSGSYLLFGKKEKFLTYYTGQSLEIFVCCNHLNELSIQISCVLLGAAKEKSGGPRCLRGICNSCNGILCLSLQK